MGKILKRSKKAVSGKASHLKVLKSEKHEAEKPKGSEVVPLSRGKRRRQYAKERRAGFVAYLAKASAQRENLKRHGKALGDMGELTSALTAIQETHTLQQDLKAMATLKSELGMTTLNRRQSERAEQAAHRIFWQRLNEDKEFLASPVNFTLAVCRKAAESRAQKLQAYKNLKDSVSSCRGS